MEPNPLDEALAELLLTVRSIKEEVLRVRGDMAEAIELLEEVVENVL